MDFPKIEQDVTFFTVIRNGVSLGVFSAFQIHQAFADDSDGEFEFDQEFDVDGLL